MIRFAGIQAFDAKPSAPAVVSIGNFDGVHLGHREILNQARAKAKAEGGALIAYTFRPHPQIALRPEADLPLLTTYDERADLLEAAGVDYLVEEPFSREFSTTTAERFFREILVAGLGARHIVVGYDFGFGKERQGSLDKLREFCREAGVGLTVVEARQAGSGEVISSSKVRAALRSGHVDAAARLLGYSYFYRGIVRRGDGRGKKLGFPTANLSPQAMEGKLVLPYGVYATIAIVKKSPVPSVTNIGVRPTFKPESEGFPVWIETHLLGGSPDLYGESLEVRFVKRIRAEKKFSGIDALKDQIRIDCDQAREALTSAPLDLT